MSIECVDQCKPLRAMFCRHWFGLWLGCTVGRLPTTEPLGGCELGLRHALARSSTCSNSRRGVPVPQLVTLGGRKGIAMANVNRLCPPAVGRRGLVVGGRTAHAGEV